MTLAASESAPTIAYIGIGGNLGDARATVEDALHRLAQLPDTTLSAQSPLYRTVPVDADGDDYVNAVAQLSTLLSPHDLLKALQNIEQAHGRQRPYRNAPRTLDLDILLYGDRVISDDVLTVPHPRMTQRAFVLIPLLAINSAVTIPGAGAAQDFRAGVANQPIHQISD
ncbi:2-amino-4-hydroxy-6-hydroxymethyldihydropteridine diphosphokinase [Herbaspirillum sp. meg3]|uniref:2-amino-4-hydroxy-6- hydroxymethyldihydropteridine diphosphokinase n=1 Tax=Herbaspirillum sp. meg3 TaxID=2025949 RepID=UPI000B98FA75|nr:2-amino-4-hydroxy-6-hydroxymethyldihydropteridine diphosphokinase [Herbaspirillum sp. meg3]ASU40405.1 2-amino-4-hydroxy-6-hydroxymethyldihydropteridine diphosphokinase [Herbaspirillum sp. meg3]